MHLSRQHREGKSIIPSRPLEGVLSHLGHGEKVLVGVNKEVDDGSDSQVVQCQHCSDGLDTSHESL
jgi:hypothetical protein